MAPSHQNYPKTKLSPARITAIYACAGGMWIIASSLRAATHTAAPEEFLSLEIAKGLGYIAFTATLLWWLCRSWTRQIRQAADERQGAQDKYEANVKSSPIAIGVVDKNGKILETNAANETLTGYSCEELKTMSIFDLDRTSSPEETAKVFAEIFEKGQAVQTRIIRRKDGSHLNIKVDGVRFESDKAICFSWDITQRIQAERKLLMLNAMLRAIRRVNKAIVEETEIENLIQRICNVFVQDRDFRHAWIALLDEDGKPNHYCDAP